MSRANPHDERAKRIGRARDAFLKAAASLTQWPLERNAGSFALFQGALGMLRLAQADHGDERFLKEAEEMIAAATTTPAQAPAGPSSLPPKGEPDGWGLYHDRVHVEETVARAAVAVAVRVAPKGEPRPVVEAVLGTCHRYNWSHGLHDGHECRDWKPTPTFETFVSRVGEGDLPTSALATAVGPGVEAPAMVAAVRALPEASTATHVVVATALEAFARQAVEAEREACARVADAVIPLIARHVIEECESLVRTTPSVWRREGTEDAEATLDEAASRVRDLIATYEEPKS